MGQRPRRALFAHAFRGGGGTVASVCHGITRTGYFFLRRELASAPTDSSTTPFLHRGYVASVHSRGGARMPLSMVSGAKRM